MEVIEDIVLMSRLVPLSFKHGTEFTEEKNISDSEQPEIRLLATFFEREFVTSKEAIESVKAGTLGKSVPHICLSVSSFPKETSLIYQQA
jgi:hypothetical protein